MTTLNNRPVVGQHYRHIKRKTLYVVVEIASFQCSHFDGIELDNEPDNEPVVVYKSVDTGDVYVRPMYEFMNQKRFKFVG